MQDAVDPQLAAAAGMGAGEHRHPRGDEDLVVDGGAVQVGVRPDQHGVADHERVVGTTPEQRVLHHEDVGADHHRTEVAGEDRTGEHAGPAPIVTSPVTTAEGAIHASG